MADFEAPSFSLGLDLTAPSFSLGLDLDDHLDLPPAPNQDSYPIQSPQRPTIDLISSPSVEDEDLCVEDTPSPPVLKRLRRGPPPHSPQAKKRISVDNVIGDPPSNPRDEGDDDDFHQPSVILDQQADDSLSAPILKRLKRGPLIQSSKLSEQASVGNEIEDISSPVKSHRDNVDDHDTQRTTPTSDLQANNSLSSTILERLKRQPPIQSSKTSEGDSIDNEIEDISSPEDNHRGFHSTLKNRSAYSGSKFSLHGFAPLSTQSASKSQAREVTQPSIASTFTSVGNSSSKPVFPNLLTTPLRKFQLLDSDSDSDSDSDDPSFNEDLSVDATKFDVSASKNHHTVKENLAINRQRTAKASESKLQTQDLWKDFDPQKRLNISTPALDEFCEEYFRSVKDKNVEKTVEGDTSATSFKIFDQQNDVSRNTDFSEVQHNPLPPAYKYFFHNDPRIQRLVRCRLPNFFPLDLNDTDSPESQADDIDYMCQFGQNESTSRSQGLGGRSKMTRKNANHSTFNNEVSGSWVNPKGCTSVSKNTGRSRGRVAAQSSSGPKNAGKRRVRAVGRSSGNWFTGEDGRKVYVTKNGQELSGQIAYRHYRKETGTGFKKSRKKAVSKKKPTRR